MAMIAEIAKIRSIEVQIAALAIITPVASLGQIGMALTGKAPSRRPAIVGSPIRELNHSPRQVQKDWDQEIERAEWFSHFPGSKRVANKMEKWGRFCGGVEAELMALACYEVLGERLGISYPTHRDGRVGHNELRMARNPLVVAKEVCDSLSANRVWEEGCSWVAWQYGQTQSAAGHWGNLDNGVPVVDGYVTLYRGVTGSVAQMVRESVKTGHTFDTRTLESWTFEYEQAERFARRNGRGLILVYRMPVERILGIPDTCDALNRSESEILTINPSGKFDPEDGYVVRDLTYTWEDDLQNKEDTEDEDDGDLIREKYYHYGVLETLDASSYLDAPYWEMDEHGTVWNIPSNVPRF